MDKYAIIIDGGFLKKKLGWKLKKKIIQPQYIIKHCQDLSNHADLKDHELFRIYYYDCPPYQKMGTNPINQTQINFSNTAYATQNQRILDTLELTPGFAVRKGVLGLRGWKLGDKALRDLKSQKTSTLNASHLVPDLSQKQVDMKIGLDIAWMSIKGIVNRIVLITGDSDFIPAMKFSRKEGVVIYLNCLGHPVSRELKVHADRIIEIP